LFEYYKYDYPTTVINIFFEDVAPKLDSTLKTLLRGELAFDCKIFLNSIGDV